MKKIIVWDLFGGGQNSVYHALDHDKYDVYTFDITEPSHEHQYKLDLSQDNIIEIFKQYPKPDIIVASPLCQSFSCVLQMKGGGTCFWKWDKDKQKLVERSVEEFERLKSGFTRNKKAETQLYVKRLGEKCINNTLLLIEVYHPKYWYIENPKNSLMWKFIYHNHYLDFYALDWQHRFSNEASLGKYGYLITKPTIFLSNVKMDLKKGRIPKIYHTETRNGVKYYVLNDDVKTSDKQAYTTPGFVLHALPSTIKARTCKGNSGMGGMDFVNRQPRLSQTNHQVVEQVSESGYISQIPPSLIQDIFSYFVV